MSALLQINYMLFQDINGHAGEHPWLDPLMAFCANYLIFGFLLLLLILWGLPLNWRKRALRPGEIEFAQERRAVVLWVGIACVLAYALNLAIEHFIFEPRPFVNHKVHLLISHAADASFPSDHAAWSFALVGMLFLALLPPLVAAWRKRIEGWRTSGFAVLFVPCLLLVAALVIACSIGFARIFVGVHYPVDILGGTVDGLLAASIVTPLRRLLNRPTGAVLRFARTLHMA